MTTNPDLSELRVAVTGGTAGLGLALVKRLAAAGARVAFILFAQKIGLSLDEIAEELAKLPGDRIPTRGDWARLSGAWTKRIDARIAELERLRSGLTACIGCGCLSIDRCALANPDDRAGRRGSGPRYWMR